MAINHMFTKAIESKLMAHSLTLKLSFPLFCFLSLNCVTTAYLVRYNYTVISVLRALIQPATFVPRPVRDNRVHETFKRKYRFYVNINFH